MKTTGLPIYPPKSSTSILTPFVVLIVLLRSVFLLCVVIYNYLGYIWNGKERDALDIF